MKKGAALLITLLIVSSIGLMAIVVGKSAIAALVANTKVNDSVVAEQLSKSGIEYGLRQCVNTTNEILMNEDGSPNYTRTLPNDQKVDIWLHGYNTGANRACQIISSGYVYQTTYKRHEFMYAGPGAPPPPPPVNGTAYLFYNGVNMGTFLAIDGQCGGQSCEYMYTNYFWRNSAGNYASFTRQWGDFSTIHNWAPVEASWVRTLSLGQVRILNGSGGLVGYLHVFKEDPAGTYTYSGLPGIKMIDQGRFVDSSVAAEIHNDNEAYALSGVTRVSTNVEEWHTDWVRTGSLRRISESLNRAVTQYQNIVLGTHPLHFLVFDESNSTIVSRLYGYSNGTQLGEFRGSAWSDENEYPDGDSTWYETSTGTVCYGWSWLHPNCLEQFAAAHPNFQYQAAP